MTLTPAERELYNTDGAITGHTARRPDGGTIPHPARGKTTTASPA
ncbi:hypothetical protein [Streptomyces aidingensis]|uniref:Uncharacterized protein n=1 Tax=Streptomyces aidingensis TaxID=910347 RepID=A0A1I1UT62_9ACTN|nr:hypothetical protein [Streptomyces aidingensis]SFD74022.1 hypothetical protein SAMN05421773_1275 [Streptomyces aidingensis]